MRFASMDLPEPGGPISRILGPPEAAISSARLTWCWPLTSVKSNSYLLGLEFSVAQYEELKTYATDLDLDFIVSCWDIDSQLQMQRFKTKYNKVASAMLVHHKLLEIIAKEKKLTIDQSITAFNASYIGFTTLFNEDIARDFPKWEAFIDGEISFQNEFIICIAMNGNVQTGEANSNLIFKFFNFDPATGKELKTKDLINDLNGFKALVKKYYDKELEVGHKFFFSDHCPLFLKKSIFKELEDIFKQNFLCLLRGRNF